jgi:hypothetical protein
MSSPARSIRRLATAVAVAIVLQTPAPIAQKAAKPVDRAALLDAMKRATTFMVEKVGTNGGYVWSYLPDFSRRWGELEARATQIWIQPPGTPTMGHLFLDAYHATGDEYYYQAAERAAGALIWAQHPSGGWNGRYYADDSPKNTLAHYSAFRAVDVVGLRKRYTEAKATAPAEATRESPLVAAGTMPLPRYFAVEPSVAHSATDAIVSLDAQGRWLVPLGTTSHPYARPGSMPLAPGNFSTTHVGDDIDTSPYPDTTTTGISTAAYIRNMSALIRALDGDARP